MLLIQAPEVNLRQTEALPWMKLVLERGGCEVRAHGCLCPRRRVMKNKPLVRYLMTGFLLLALGWIIIFFMAIDVVQPSFFLNFFGFGLSLAGLLCGIAGIVLFKK